MARHRRYPTPAIVGAACLVLCGSGCVSPLIGEPPSPQAPYPDTTLTSYPPVASSWDAETITESVNAAIVAYLSLTDAIAGDGGEMASRMAQATTPEWFPTEQTAFDHYRDRGVRTVGETLVDSVVVQNVWEPVSGGIEVDVFSCVDARGVWLVPREAPDPPEGLMEWVMSPRTFQAIPEDGVEDAPEEIPEEWFEYLDTYQPQPGVKEAIVWWLRGSEAGALVVDGSTHWDGGPACLD
jgi:hypothetical protein